MTATAVPASSTEVAGAPPLEPYKGLAPYLESDYDLFFGRERETEIICANLTAARLTLLYGDSGVGKSSVLLAGAAHRLREEARRNREEFGRPEFAVVVYRAWRDDPVRCLIAEVRRAVTELVGGEGAVDLPEGASLADVLHAETERLDGDLVVILDQFDEYFLYHGTEDGEGTFAVEFPRAVNRPDLRASFLVSMREDTVAKLDRFKGRIPFLFDNRLRIDHLGVEAARAAIELPIGAYNERVDPGAEVSIEPALVDEILRQIGGSTVPLGQVGAGDVSGASAALADERIEAPYLQVVLRRLWLEEVKAGSHVLRAETLDRLGGCESIVRTRLGELMEALTPSERDIAAEVFRYLVTSSGTKVAHSAADLAEFADLPEAGVSRVLEHLATTDVRLLRAVQPPPGGDGGTRYEISHDVIGPAILDWRTRHVHEKLAHRERRKTRIWAAVALASLLACAGVAVLAVFSVWAMRHAQDAEQDAEQAEQVANSARTTARAQELVAAATAELTEDPAQSLSKALDALRLDEGMPQAEVLLREGLPQLRLRTIVPGVQDSRAAALSPASAPPLAALPGEDGVVQIVDVETGDEVSTLSGHEAGVVAATFTDDGEQVATVGSDGSARVWDSATGEEAWELPASPVAAVAIDPNGRWVVSAGADGLRLFDLESESEIASAEGDFVSVAASGDGRRIVSVRNHGNAQVWDVSGSDLTSVRRLERPEVSSDRPYAPFMYPSYQAVQPTDFSLAELNEKGTRVLTVSQDDQLRLWKVRDGSSQDLPGAPAQVQDAAFSPNGKLVAAAQQKTIRVWHTVTLEEVAEMRGHQDWVNQIDFREDGRNLLSASSDGTARVWETGSGLLLMALRGHSASVDQAGFVGDGTLAVTVSQDGTARTWDVGTGTELRRHGKRVTDLALSSDGRTVATVGADGRLVTWDAQTGERLRDTRADYVGAATSVEFSPEEVEPAVILTAGMDSTATLWDAESLDFQALVVHAEGATINQASFSPDGDRIVTAGDDGVARVWARDVVEEFGTESLVLQDDDVPPEQEQSHAGNVLDAAFSPDGSTIVTVGEDGIARVWGAEQGEELLEFDKHVRAVTSVAFHPKEAGLVVTGGRDGTARVWNVVNDDEPDELEVLQQPEAVSTVAFSPDGRWIVTGSPDGVTRVWDWRAGKLLGSMRMHADYVNAAALTTDRRVLTASDDHSAKIYECGICGGLAEVEEQAKSRLRELGLAPSE